jgi:hypothetical protein
MTTKPGKLIRQLQPGAILQSLIGSWAIERRIDAAATLTGAARFDRSGDAEAAYHEQGTLRLANGTEVAAERRYIFRQRLDGFVVFFDERPPRLFHQVKLVSDPDGCLRGAAEHVCADDIYLTDYQFDSCAQFQARHRVRGPRKAYTMVTVYRRMADTSR